MNKELIDSRDALLIDKLLYLHVLVYIHVLVVLSTLENNPLSKVITESHI